MRARVWVVTKSARCWARAGRARSTTRSTTRFTFDPASDACPLWWPDGQRFLVNNLVSEGNSQPITLVLNWAAAPKR